MAWTLACRFGLIEYEPSWPQCGKKRTVLITMFKQLAKVTSDPFRFFRCRASEMPSEV